MAHSHRSTAALIAWLIAVLAAPATVRAQTQYELTPLELPAELDGNVVSRNINNRGEVLGWGLQDHRVGVVAGKEGVRTFRNRGVVAGTWSDGITSRAGVLEDGVLIPIDYPAPPTVDYQDPETGTIVQLTLGSSYTTVTGINDGGEIFGHTEATYFGPDFSFEVVRAFPFTGAPLR